MVIRQNKRKPWGRGVPAVWQFHEKYIRTYATNGIFMPLRNPDGVYGWRKRLIRGWEPCQVLSQWVSEEAKGGDFKAYKHCKNGCPSSGMQFIIGSVRRRKQCPDRVSSYDGQPSATRWRPRGEFDVRGTIKKPTVFSPEDQLTLPFTVQ